MSKNTIATLTLKSPEENTFNDWAAQAQEHLENLEHAKSEGLCVYCGDEADNGDCGKYKCWIY